MATKFKDRPKNLTLNRLMVLCAGISGFLALHFTYFSLSRSFSVDRFTYENIGMAFLISYGFIPFILSMKYPLYWVFFSKGEQTIADERQKNVRKSVYERAYRLFAVYSLLAYWIYDNPDTRMQLVFWWFIAITFVSLPILIAAWRKDS